MRVSELVKAFSNVSFIKEKDRTKEISILGVSTDSRSIKKGDCFFAIKGERFDAHDFVKDTAERGAAVAVVEQDVDVPSDFPVIRVKNTVEALQQLAVFYRGCLELPLIAVAGSNGKTSTKELIAAAISSLGKITKTQGNLNNYLGVPLTLLGIDLEDRAAVVELGTNHPGEIAFLTQIAKPTVGVITNIGLEHLEFFKNEAGVAEEEGSLLTFMSEKGTAILNADDCWFETLKQRAHGKVITVGFNNNADVILSLISQSDEGQVFTASFVGRTHTFEIPLVGQHFVTNAGLAIATGLALGISLETMREDLKKVILPSGRMKIVQGANFKIIDDTYNANPSSMQAALQYLATQKGRRIAVLGDMGELGQDESYWHRVVGQEAAKLALDLVVAIGREANSYAQGIGSTISVKTFSEIEPTLSFLKEIVRRDDVILVKASRSSRLERVVNALTALEKSGGALC